MNKILTLCFSLIILSSCQEKNKYEDKNELCRVLGEIHLADQKYRGSKEMTDPFFRVLDSLQKVNNLPDSIYRKLSTEEQLEWGRKARAISNKIPQISKRKEDSLMQLQIKLDNKNTELLIDIISKKGWVYKNKIGCNEYFSAWLVFRHSQSQYWDEIRILIDDAKEKGTIGRKDYNMIDNHIKGRPIMDSRE